LTKPAINTSTNIEEIIMDTTDQTQAASAGDPQTQRAVIKSALDEIAAEVSGALRQARLDFPVYLTVPNSGSSLATIACPLDPSDEEWSQASEIVCRIMGKHLGGIALYGRGLECAVANPAMAAAEVAVESIESDAAADPTGADA
jgi:hypothetical protein